MRVPHHPCPLNPDQRLAGVAETVLAHAEKEMGFGVGGIAARGELEADHGLALPPRFQVCEPLANQLCRAFRGQRFGVNPAGQNANREETDRENRQKFSFHRNWSPDPESARLGNRGPVGS